MLGKMRSLLTRMGGGTDGFKADDPRLAITALLLRVMSVDGVIEPEEQSKIAAILKDDFRLGRSDAEALVQAARRLDAEASDLSVLAERAKRGLDAAGRLKLVDRLWEVTVADHHIHEFEDSLVWRLADLLGVPVHERVSSRQKAGKTLSGY